jgi:hypothetical protein
MDGIEEKTKPDILRWILIALAVLVVGGLIGGGVFVYKKALGRKEAGQLTPTPEPLPAVEVTETPEAMLTPTEELDKADLKIKILNGTGVPGAAGKAVQLLEKLGYQGIKTGNADAYDYEKTEIKIKESKMSYLSLLSQDLEDEYPLATETGTLEESEDFDVEVILGKPKGE